MQDMRTPGWLLAARGAGRAASFVVERILVGLFCSSWDVFCFCLLFDQGLFLLACLELGLALAWTQAPTSVYIFLATRFHYLDEDFKSDA